MHVIGYNDSRPDILVDFDRGGSIFSGGAHNPALARYSTLDVAYMYVECL